MRVKRQPLNQSGLESSSSSFVITAIPEQILFQEPAVFFVYNHPDRAKLAKGALLDGLTPVEAAEGQKEGKPAGYGMPCGGVNPEHLENKDQAARREGENESGLKILRVDEVSLVDPVTGLPIKKNKVLIFDKRTDKFVRFVMYADGQQEKVEIAPWEYAKFNPMHYYFAKVDWERSKPREFFLNLKEDLVSNCDAADKRVLEDMITRFGLSANYLERDELLSLGVDQEEVAEVGGFALIPISHVRNMFRDKWYYLDLDESRETHKREGPTSYCYASHIERIVQVYDILGIK